MFLQVVVQLVVPKTFLTTGNTELVLKLVTVSLSPLFGSGLTCAYFHSYGVFPLLKLVLKREVRVWLIAGATFLINLALMQSAPHALFVSKLLSTFLSAHHSLEFLWTWTGSLTPIPSYGCPENIPPFYLQWKRSSCKIPLELAADL